MPSSNTYSKLFIVLVLCLFFSLATWSTTMRLDMVAVAEGEVFPRGKVKKVQHFEGGIVESIFVKDGDLVSKGDALIKLHLGAVRVNVFDLESQYKALSRKLLRLEAEEEGRVLDFGPGKTELDRVFIDNETAIYEARADQIRSIMTVLDQKIGQSTFAIDENKSRIRGVERSLELLHQQLDSTKRLYSERLVTKADYLELKNQITLLDSQLQELESVELRLLSVRDEAIEQKESEWSEIRKRRSEDKVKVTNNLARLDDQLKPARDIRKRETITSPVSGIVKNSVTTTIGGVVGAGAVLLEVVPNDGDLVVIAKLDPIDVASVKERMRAVIKLSALNFLEYGTISGLVRRVAPDSTREKGSPPYYQVEIELDATVLRKGDQEFKIVPGMIVSVDIKTGEKSVLQYFIEPIFKSLNNSFSAN
jgi:membrane fusion protein, adhesin transport system